MAKKKFDTNPLDPTFPERIKEEAETVALPKTPFKTAEFSPPSVTEEETRRFDGQNFNQYQSGFSGREVPANYQTRNLAGMNESSNRRTSKIGLPENTLTALPYIPWFVGLVAGILILLYVPKSETKARFHAAQGLAAHFAILMVTTILGIVDNFAAFASTANFVFQIVTTIMLIVFTVRAWQGKPVHIEAVDDLTEWLEEKIKPKK